MSHSSTGLQPARLDFNADGVPCAPDYGDVYHATAGAFEQARQVFLAGSGLPQRWASRPRFVILETGFGLGNNFLATWDAWRQDPNRCERLIFVSIEKHPLTPEDAARAHAGSRLPELAAQLVQAWPHATPDIHLLDFEDGRVQLMLALGDVVDMLSSLQVQADALYLDGFSPALNADMWSAEVFRRLPPLLAPGATAATWSVARAVRDGLSAIGFDVQRAPGFGGKRDRLSATYAPRFQPPLPRAWANRPNASNQEQRHALVIGAGLAGCAAVHALALQGWRATLIDRNPDPAQGTSSNAGGLFHATFNAPDSLHARWFRAAADLTQRLAAPAVREGRVAGQVQGFTRLDPRVATDKAESQLTQVGLPRAVVDWNSAPTLHEALGVPVTSGGWRFGQGGWLSPADHCRALLAAADALIPHTWIGGCPVDRIKHRDGRWLALDNQGKTLAEAPALILANALDAARLLLTLDTEDRSCTESALAMTAVRGQTTVLPPDWPGLCVPRGPLSGQGYALRLPDGRVLIGATTQHHDDDPAVRESDHRHNLTRAAQLGVVPEAARQAALPPELGGRTGWRATTPDRLPWAGPLVDAPALQQLRTAGRDRLHRAAHLPRIPGLYALCGLGSRGITSAALAARVLVAHLSGAPCPVPEALRDALDPARAALSGHRKPAANVQADGSPRRSPSRRL